VSELTLCNRCTLELITAQANGKTVTCERVPITEEMGGWFAVTVDGRRVAWFMELSEVCCC
jgi:hypothetical protein